MKLSVFPLLPKRGQGLPYGEGRRTGMYTILSWIIPLFMSFRTKQDAPKLIHFSTSCEHLLEGTTVVWAYVCHEITVLLIHFSVLCSFCQVSSPCGKKIQILPFIQHKMRWADTIKAKGLPLDAINIFPLFSFSKMLRPDLVTLLYILCNAPSEKTLGLHETMLCVGEGNNCHDWWQI